LDNVDRQLLDLLQQSLPLVPRPFAALARAIGSSEREILSRTRRLKAQGIIRQIGPIFSSRRLGYQSTLAAFQVAPRRLDEVAALISAHPGVSHNYSRNHLYNLWFTLTLPPGQSLDEEIARLAEAASVDDYLNLPSLRLFKIGVHFDMSGESKQARQDIENLDRSLPRATVAPCDNGGGLTDFERDIVLVMQGDLTLVERPFQGMAAQLGVTEQRLLAAARALDQRGVMRRFSAVLKHRRAGFTANGMGCWELPEERIPEAGQAAAAFAAVSHCYQRPAYPPEWPYNLFTMVHGRTREEVEEIVSRIRGEIDPLQHTILYSQKEYKKERVRYFVEE
jgi:DNA-binding Lrp family transcriptional regulator